MQLSPELVLALVGQIFTAGAIYGAIRADLRRAQDKADDAHEAANQAHDRIDNLLLKDH